jgi:hypothetical protein
LDPPGQDKKLLLVQKMASEAESENFKEVDEFASKDRPVVMNVHPSLFVKPAIEKLNV